MPAQRRCVGQALERAERGDAAAGAEQPRREVDQQLVDLPGGQQRGVEAVAGLDMQLVDAAPAQVVQHRDEVDLAVRIGQADQLGALRAQRGGAAGVVGGRDGVVDGVVDQHRARRRQQPRGRRRLQP